LKNLTDSADFLKIADLIVTPLIIVEDSSPNPNHLYFNKAFITQIGYTVNSVPNLIAWFEQAYPDEDYRKEIIYCWNRRKAIAENRGHSNFHLEAKVFCADGSYCWYDIHETQINNLTVITFLNIDDMEGKNELLTNAIQQKNLLLSIIAHDVRDPLLNIKTLLDNLSYANLDLEKRKFNKIVSDLDLRVDNAINIVNSTLLRIGIERGVFIFQPDVIDLELFFKKRYEDFSHRLARKNIQLLFKLEHPKAIYYDRFILEIAFVNIINYIINDNKHNSDIIISNIDEKRFSSLIITDERLKYELDDFITLSGDPTFVNEKSDNSGLIGAQKIIEENGGQLITHSKNYNGTAWEIRINKQDVL
jgi:K+-sensing histidine kinase KdpD